jgi:hypothetical protein
MHRLRESRRTACRTVSVFAFVLAFAVAVNAYTVVTSGGRRLEIPSQFVVTAATLTYEVSPGVQVTLLMAAINIPATEKANNEAPGSLLRRAALTAREAAAPAARIPTAPARRTITNLDLEPTALRRRQSELTYEDRRKQLGLPSVEESRRQAAAESESIKQELEEQRLADSKTEEYWRERATALRTEMAAVDAESAWIRARLDEGPTPNYGWNGWSGGLFTSVISVGSFGNVHGGRSGSFGGNFGGRRGFHGGGPARPGVFVAPNRGPQLTGRVPFGGGATRGQVLLNPGFRAARSNRVAGGFPVFATGFPVFGSVPAYDYSYERGDLITRFNELAGARAGLNARWRELEEEARRAGASPGWLRP